LLSKATGGELRPGGMDLTEQMIELCHLPAKSRILDLGSGTGATVELLVAAGFQAVGVDRSETLLQTGKMRKHSLPLSCGWSKSLPVANGQIDAIFAECSFTAMSDLDAVLDECWRVLRPGGRLASCDVYARDPQGVSALRLLPVSCDLREAISRLELEAKLLAHGFKILAWEDHSEVLKYLTAQLILSHGSMDEFWSQAEPSADPRDIQTAINKAKLGYYLLVAEKKWR
jgi:ubiquinone/menaquinone biosynthesis C-methylase UbiE